MPQALRYDLCLDLIRPMSMSLTSSLPGCEKLRRRLYGETPVLHPWKADHRSGGDERHGTETPVTVSLLNESLK